MDRPQPAKAGAITVWKSPTCGCCGGWVDYMRGKGYQVAVNLVADPDPIKAKLGVPEALYSCHTAKVDGYLVEGHVPEAAVAKLLAERPDLKGIALPGMPDGAPGMDGTPGIYRIVGFDAQRAHPPLRGSGRLKSPITHIMNMQEIDNGAA